MTAAIAVVPAASARLVDRFAPGGWRRGLGGFGTEPSEDLVEPVDFRTRLRDRLDRHRRGCTRGDALDHRFLSRLLGLFLLLSDQILFVRLFHHVERCWQGLALIEIVVAKARN